MRQLGLFVNLADLQFSQIGRRFSEAQMVSLYFAWPHRRWKIALKLVVLGWTALFYLEASVKG